jgi:hypothetical protein
MTAKRRSERTIAAAIGAGLRAIPDNRATVAQLIHVLPVRLALTKAHLARNPSRPAERRWEQRVRSRKSQKWEAVYRLRAMPDGFALPVRPAKHVGATLANTAREVREARQ